VVPHFTTLANFVSRHADEIDALFEQGPRCSSATTVKKAELSEVSVH
jgi:hypothetical protein